VERLPGALIQLVLVVDVALVVVALVVVATALDRVPRVVLRDSTSVELSAAASCSVLDRLP